MKQIKCLFIYLVAFFSVIVCNSCERDGNETIALPSKREIKPIEEIIPKDLLDIVPINPGYDPPDITGGYIVDPYILTYSTLPHDSIGYKWNAQLIKFTKQTYENTLIYESVQGDSKVSQKANIQGSGDLFTVYFIEVKKSPSTGMTVTTASIISGKKTDDGIRDYKYSFIVTNSDAGTIAPGNIREFEDRDGLVETYNW